jgi:hypothetical protein
MKNRIIKIVLYFWLFICFLFGIISLFSVPDQMKKDRQFIEKEIKPSILVANNFKAKFKRLPTCTEFDSLVFHKYSSRILRDNKDLTEDIKSYKIPDSNSFIIGVWRGEWEEYYISWLNKFITNNYKWEDGFKGLFVFLIIGFAPLAIYIITHKLIIKKRSKAPLIS